jgi:hypothetical protein
MFTKLRQVVLILLTANDSVLLGDNDKVAFPGQRLLKSFSGLTSSQRLFNTRECLAELQHGTDQLFRGHIDAHKRTESTMVLDEGSEIGQITLAQSLPQRLASSSSRKTTFAEPSEQDLSLMPWSPVTVMMAPSSTKRPMRASRSLMNSLDFSLSGPYLCWM